MTREYKCVNTNMARYLAILAKLLYKFDDVTIKHVPRIKNEKYNEALMCKLNKSKFIKMIHFQEHLDLADIRKIICASLCNTPMARQ